MCSLLRKSLVHFDELPIMGHVYGYLDFRVLVQVRILEGEPDRTYNFV